MPDKNGNEDLNAMSKINKEVAGLSQNETARSRTFMEKGRKYHLNLSLNQQKSTYKKWRKQLNKLRALVVDIEDVTQLRDK